MSNTTISDNAADISSGKLGRLVTFAAVFIVLFLPPLVLLLIQIYRSIAFQLYRGALQNIFWIRLKDIPKRPNFHLLVKVSFAFICIVRVIQGLMFLLLVLFDPTDDSLDSAIRYWISYIAINIMFTCVCVLLYYWLELGLATLDQLGREATIPVPLTIFLICINIVFHVVTAILLATLVDDSQAALTTSGDASTNLFQEIYFFGVSLPMLLLAIAGKLYVKYFVMGPRILKHQDLSNQALIDPGVNRAFRKIGIFLIIVIIAFGFRVIADFVIIYFTFSDESIQPTIIFLWDSVPEIVLCYSLAAITWIKKNEVKGKQNTKEMVHLIAPELSFSEDTTDTPLQNIELPQIKEDQE